MTEAERPEYERVHASSIEPGQRVARARTHPFELVTAVRRNVLSIRLSFHGTPDAVPRNGELWWLEVSPDED